MATVSRYDFKLLFPHGAQPQAVSLVTFSCHLSSEISAVDKEVQWFRDTRCVCLYKKGQNIEGRGYEDRVSLFTEELTKGNVSLRLKDFTESDLGQYHCKVIDGDRTEELTLGVLIITDIDSPQVFISQIDREWTKEENTIMEESALLTEYKAVNERLEQQLNESKKQKEDKDTELKNRDKIIKGLNVKVEEMEKKLGEKKKELDERNKHLSERDAVLKNINEKLKNAMEQIKEKNTQLDNLNKQLNEKETQVKNTDQELVTSKNKLETLVQELQNNRTQLQEMIVLEEKKTELSEKNKQLEEQKCLLTERETQLTERDKTLQENAKLLTENAQTLHMKDKTLEERDTSLKQAKVELDKTVAELKNSQQHIEEQSTELKNTNKLLSETETQLKDTDKELETSNNKWKTLKQELQDKTSELQKMMTIVEQQKTELGENRRHLAEKERSLTERETQLMDKEKQLQEKGKLLTENAQMLQLKDKTLEEKDIKLSDVNSKLQDMAEKLQGSQRQLEQKERQVAKTHKELETSKNQLEIMGQELQDKNRQINEMTNLLEQQKTELADKDKQVERDKQTHPDSSVPVKKRNSIDGLPPYMGGESSTSEAALSHPVPELRLVLLGRMSSGKCMARNIILGSEMNQAATFTSIQQSESTQGEVAGRKVTVVDTLDWFSPGLSLEELKQDMGLCVHLSAPGPHAFLLVIPVKQHTGEESGMLEILEQNLGERCWINTMILFTITDELQRENIEEFIQSGDPELQRLVGKCENRFQCLNIKESGDGSQVSELMEKIEEMVEGREKFYSSEIYLETESQIRAMENKILKEREEKRISEEREMRDKLEKEVQDSLRKIEGVIQEHEGDIRQLDDRTTELERKMKEERDEEKKRELERELKRDVERRTEMKEKIKKLKEKTERERREMEERHQQEMEEIREVYEGEAKMEAEQNLMKIILPELQRNILASKTKMQEEFSRQMEEKNRELETLKQKFSKFRETHSLLEEVYEKTVRSLESERAAATEETSKGFSQKFKDFFH